MPSIEGGILSTNWDQGQALRTPLAGRSGAIGLAGVVRAAMDYRFR